MQGEVHFSEEIISDSEHIRTALLELPGCRVEIKDSILEKEADSIRLSRRISGRRMRRTADAEGISIEMKVGFENEGRELRYAIPSCWYESGTPGRHTFMEDRLTAPFVLAYDEADQNVWVLQKIQPAGYSEKAVRRSGQSCFLQKTETASLGYICNERGEQAFLSCWPCEERDKSVALDARGTPVQAFYPLREEEWKVELEYEFDSFPSESFTAALYQVFKKIAGIMEKQGETTVVLPYSLNDAMAYRKISLMRSYQEFIGGGAGFFFHFDPCRGYGSEPSGFGAAFNTIPHDTYVHILEYGFTGRQLNAALIAARGNEPVWKERAKRVIEFFLKKCLTDNGWVYSLYDLDTGRPFCSFGDPEAPKLHYIDYAGCRGNYLRTMTEPMKDLVECYQWFDNLGDTNRQWLEASERFAGFLLARQNQDGSWYRAYEPDGTPVFMDEDSNISEMHNDAGRKAATAIPIGFLCKLFKSCPEKEEYREAAVRAGCYVLQHEVKNQRYQGGTLDNPNIVDKEAAQYAMASCYELYELTGEERFLDGALQAAQQFVTWNYIWNAPMQKDTILGQKGFKTKGMGAINSIWCGGVVDIYSLFHVRELYLIGKAAKEPFLEQMAEWISVAAQQILSYPEDNMGFKGIGMQPEGFGICAQGIDEGMIAKGDIWGTLGWIYSAGIDGVKRYLEERT